MVLNILIVIRLKLQDDGKIVLAGNANGMNALVARFLPDGQFDLSFAQKGYTDSFISIYCF